MKAYASLTNIYDTPAKDLQFEVLNELKNLSSRCDRNCLYHTRFVFECDNTDLDKQYVRANGLKDISCRATFSGSKSVHVIMEFGKELEDICAAYYKEIWSACNRLFFDNEADKACANPARLTRRPGAIRENGKEQTLIYDTPENLIRKDSDTWKRIWRASRALIASRMVTHADYELKDQKTFSKNHDGMCRNYDVVEYYLKKSFPKLTGNGDSSISLFKAVRCCLRYGDNRTLYDVLHKARSERWSESELSRLQESIKRKYL